MAEAETRRRRREAAMGDVMVRRNDEGGEGKKEVEAEERGERSGGSDVAREETKRDEKKGVAGKIKAEK